MNMIRLFMVFAAFWTSQEASGMSGPEHPAGRAPIVFAARIDAAGQIPGAVVMVESLRTFGGRLKDAPFRLYLSESAAAAEAETLSRLKSLGAEIKTHVTPRESAWYPLSSWVFSAAEAEAEAEKEAPVLAWLGEDTVFLGEPAEFILPEGKALGYRPVFHRNICPLYEEPLDAFWTRAYELMGVRDSDLFPMTTPADGDRIRPYFQAGCLVVRPERGLLRKWREMFRIVSGDPAVRGICGKDAGKRTFAFQAALSGALVNGLGREEMLELSDRVNYPIFFREMFGAKRDFHDITDAVTIRYEHFFVDPPAGWERLLRGPSDKIAWVKEKLDKKS